MTRKRHHKSTALFAALFSVLLWLDSDVNAGPVAGQRQALDSADTSRATSEPDGQNEQARTNANTASPDNLVSSYLDALKSQILPDIRNPKLDDTNQISLDGLQGWSLDDIKAAMDAAALGLDESTGATPLSENTPNPLTVSVDDLYNFNTGYYFVIENSNQNESGDLVSGPKLPEIIGETALGDIKLDIISISETGINLGIETGVGMLDDSFFTPLNSSSANQSIGSRGFRAGIGAVSGGRQGSGSDPSSSQPNNLTGWITRSIEFLRENGFSIALVVLGFTAIGYLTSRFA